MRDLKILEIFLGKFSTDNSQLKNLVQLEILSFK